MSKNKSYFEWPREFSSYFVFVVSMIPVRFVVVVTVIPVRFVFVVTMIPVSFVVVTMTPVSL
jgi:hypothetical protein